MGFEPVEEPSGWRIGLQGTDLAEGFCDDRRIVIFLVPATLDWDSWLEPVPHLDYNSLILMSRKDWFDFRKTELPPETIPRLKSNSPVAELFTALFQALPNCTIDRTPE